ncbi:ABC transporter permease [Suipraeoptans intestinalis]|uniref:ABC transporter permease n=1 Tax=Suipraeoptans intestinalis TaxID=2606628 RepID=UPI0023F4C9D5|nr:ABC transporter permease [Suipraeoptans intestinalis]MDD7771088.1 ABC transporter permease [Suipraeoptans intestinalis]MDY3122712.1 ABC transporter permease [Suipraeoptans intestinalis]
MKGIREIFGKEMARIFRDKKMVFSVFVLPVVIMLVIFSVVGMMAERKQKDIEAHKSRIYTLHAPTDFQQQMEASGFLAEYTQMESEKEFEAAKKKIKEGEIDLIVRFSDGFEEQTKAYKEGEPLPWVNTYENPSEEYSAKTSSFVKTMLESYRQTLLAERVGDLRQLTVFEVNTDNSQMYIQDKAKATGKMAGTMLPYFVTVFLFAGAMGIGTDMIAGEKERGTMYSLLVTPIQRSSIVLGKVFSLMTISGISAIVYVTALAVAANTIFKDKLSGANFHLDIQAGQIAMLGVLLLFMSFLYSTIIALISVFAKTVKEAGTYIMPAYMLVLIIGLISMFSTGKPQENLWFVPFYNNAMAIQGIMSQEITLFQYGITVAETLALGVILTGVIVKAFESEKVMSK